MENDLPTDPVEMLRMIRDRHYEDTKHMTQDEKRVYDKKRIDTSNNEFEQRIASLQPDFDRFPFLSKK